MKPRVLLLLALLFLLASPGFAQTVRGQILLPGGGIPSEPIRFWLFSGDGQVNEEHFTDSNGRFVLRNVSGNYDYTIEVRGDNILFSTTRHNFNAAYNSNVRVTLNPPLRKESKPGTVSVATAYKPDAEAAELREAALKDIEKEDLVAAEAKLVKAVGRDPKFALALSDLGAIYLLGRKHAEAEKVLRQAVAADPKAYMAFLNRVEPAKQVYGGGTLFARGLAPEAGVGGRTFAPGCGPGGNQANHRSGEGTGAGHPNTR